MGHANVRAAIIYQHATSGADQAIAKALGKQFGETVARPTTSRTTGPPGHWFPQAIGT
ncbi:hypothetical protein [Cryptosporangium sp. NPDC051539]|uniref:hypothetical protein n=1 Tax=Cryptosporangium sp. NPDC051539 TaxID=3363962 RepID=UPI0037A04E9D